MADPASGNTRAPSPPPMPVPAVLRWCLHAVVGGLLCLSIVRALATHVSTWPWIAGAACVVGLVYVNGPRRPAERRSLGASLAWVGLVLATWLVLLGLTQDATYLAFPWFILIVYLLPRRIAVVAVTLTTAAAIAGFAWHQGTFTAAMVVGPVLGACVALVTVLGYQTLQAESEQRRRLIVELDRTRSDLASTQRRAGVLAERERVAREIHDTIAQGLSSIQLLLRAAGRSLEPDRTPGSGRVSGLVEQARQAAQDNLAEVRQLVRGLAPAGLRESSLSPALQRLCDNISAQSGIRVAFRHEGPVMTLPTPIEVTLLRIAQSALGNTAQHSGATRADVTLTVTDATATLEVIDNGCGFHLAGGHPAAPTNDHEGGFGFTSMRSRAAELDGTFIVESQPGHGTAVSVRFAHQIARAEASHRT